MLDGAFLSHVILWGIGALAALGTVLMVGAFFTLGRSSYRKD